MLAVPLFNLPLQSSSTHQTNMEFPVKINITPTNVPPITKDPLFLSAEIESVFILMANLKGYQKEKIKIDRDEDGTQIAVTLEKALPRKFAGFRMTPQVARFRKVFWIPDGVDVGHINAIFSEKESVLWIFMPKLVKGSSGIGVEEVKEGEIGKVGLGRNRTLIPQKVPEIEMKEVKKDLPPPEPEVAERESNHGKREEDKKDVKPNVDEVAGGLSQLEPESKEATGGGSPTENGQKTEEGKKDKKVDEDGGSLSLLNPSKNVQKMDEGKKDTEAPGATLEKKKDMVKQEAADIATTSTEEEPTPSDQRQPLQKEETPAKMEYDSEARGGAAEEVPTLSDERQALQRKETPAKMEYDSEARGGAAEANGEDITEPTRVEAGLTQRDRGEEYDVNKENGEAETRTSQQEPNAEIQEASQLIFDQEPLFDPENLLESDNPEDVQGMDQAETDTVIPPRENFCPCLFAGSSIFISIVALVIFYIRCKRR